VVMAVAVGRLLR